MIMQQKHVFQNIYVYFLPHLCHTFQLFYCFKMLFVEEIWSPLHTMESFRNLIILSNWEILYNRDISSRLGRWQTSVWIWLCRVLFGSCSTWSVSALLCVGHVVKWFLLPFSEGKIVYPCIHLPSCVPTYFLQLKIRGGDSQALWFRFNLASTLRMFENIMQFSYIFGRQCFIWHNNLRHCKKSYAI